MPTDALLARIAALSTGPGCYIYKDAGGIEIYVGKAKNLRRRVSSYFQSRDGHPQKTLRLVQEVADLATIETDSEVEALLLENALIKDLQPRYNLRLKDDKTFPLLAITRDEFPRVFITRDRQLPQVDYIGPFISSTDLRRAYHFLMRVFRFRVCDLDIHESDASRRSFRPCLNFHIKRCSGPCTTAVTRADYGEDIRGLRAFLSGRGKGTVLASLDARMRQAAGDQRYEDAARFRDQMRALDRLKERGSLRDYDEPSAPTIDAHAGLERLQQHLGLPAPPRIIEGFDIAHLQGSHVVASLVQFVSGVPNKDGYRRFRVRGEDGAGEPGNDDFAAMREVVGRRYRRLRDERTVFPDLVLVDGGAGQLAMAEAVLAEAGVAVPCLIGLAKREESIIRRGADGTISEISLSRRDPGLKLLMYVRDEAHRFCRRYYHFLQHRALATDLAQVPAPAARRRRRPAREAPAPPVGGDEAGSA
jgi:excinuclease ABC subunit C